MRFNSRKSTTDNYETPYWGTAELAVFLESIGINFDAGGVIEDPCCGRGAIIDCLAEFYAPSGCVFRGSDIRDVQHIKPRACRYPEYRVSDFFSSEYCPHPNTKAFIFNPPFTLADDFALKALSYGVDVVALLQRSQYREGMTRYEKVFSRHPYSYELQFAHRLSMEQEGQARLTTSGMMTFSWFVWVKGTQGHPRCIWITMPPCFKADRRLVATWPGGVVEVRDLLELDRHQYKFYRLNQPCQHCGYPIIALEKRCKDRDWFCGNCKRDYDVRTDPYPMGFRALYSELTKKERTQFEQKHRVA